MSKFRFTKGPCRAARFPIRGRQVWGVHCHGEIVGVAYNGQGDAELWSRSMHLLGELKHMVAIVRMREGDLRASERAKYEAARALINELN